MNFVCHGLAVWIGMRAHVQWQGGKLFELHVIHYELRTKKNDNYFFISLPLQYQHLIGMLGMCK